MISIPAEVLRSACGRAPLTALIFMLVVTGCDNPAPGEGMPKPLAEAPEPKLVSASEALHSPDLTAVDPGTLDQAEILKVVPPGPRCSFRYTDGSSPVLAGALVTGSTTAKGVVKLHGRLVEVTAQSVGSLEALADGATFTAEGLRLTVIPEGDEVEPGQRRVANLEFELEQGLLVGYRGWYTCEESD